MSWEGYIQVVCTNGHAHDEDADKSPSQMSCIYCSSNIAWYNIVDTTNGSFEYNNSKDCGERIDGYIELELIEESKYHTCTCGHNHVIEEARYKIPTVGGTKIEYNSNLDD